MVYKYLENYFITGGDKVVHAFMWLENVLVSQRKWVDTCFP